MYGEFSYLCENNLICEKSTLMKNNIISLFFIGYGYSNGKKIVQGNTHSLPLCSILIALR